MFTRANRRLQAPPINDFWAAPNLELLPSELYRGNTAVPSEQKYPKQRLPISSHNFHPKNTKVTLQGSGWNSRMHKQKRYEPVRTAPYVPRLKKPEEERKQPEDFQRPPSRHKTPPKATGLELPPRVGTPPDESVIQEMFDRTWTHGIKNEKETRPAWQDTVERPKTKGRRSLKEASEESKPKRPKTGSHKKLHEIPLIVTTEEHSKRRVLSANRVPPKEEKKGFESSLDQDFLKLFE